MLVTPELSRLVATLQPAWPQAPSIDPTRVPAPASRRLFRLWCVGSEFRPRISSKGPSERKLWPARLGELPQGTASPGRGKASLRQFDLSHLASSKGA